MNIALDATYSIGDELSGVGIYSREILTGLARAHPEARFDFYYRPHRYLKARGNYRFPNTRRRLLAGPFGPARADLFHGLNQRLPEQRLKRSVATFHDLFVMTGEYSTPEFRRRFTLQARDAAERADAIVAVSAFTASQVTSLLGVPASKVHVVHHGIRELSLPARERQRFILNVGAIQKRKNIIRLVEAFEKVDPEWSLVLAGSQGYGAEEILARIQASPARPRIQVTGYVSAAELAGWYATAMVFAFPSLDEGFGIPVLEAMASSLPVITSNRAALPEVAGDATLLVNPENGEELASALQELTRNPDLREDLARRGAERARLFPWEKAVCGTWNVYRTLFD